ncbi:MAG: hypothetical protein JWM40_1333 [Frankiales bacterium]|nr:hypothetical protein [Frankiales bacterium]
MHLKSIHAEGFKRFTDLTVDGLAPNARLIVLAGPNGSGKSSFFDLLKVWHWYNGGPGSNYDVSYHQKIGAPVAAAGWPSSAVVSLHDDLSLLSPEEKKKLVYVRSAHRNEAEFTMNGLNQLPPPLDSPRVGRSIDNDVSVSQNYQRLILETLSAVYDETLAETMPRIELRDKFIAGVRQGLQAIFPDLTLTGVSNDPITGGTFRFSKGGSSDFPYKNLSAGEKAAFDLLLDASMSGRFYDKTIWCIDEPETHLNVRVQAKLLDELLKLLPKGCQLVLASHSLGFMRRAWELAQLDPEDVQFLDFQDLDFDQTIHMQPTMPTREFWNRTLDVAMGDLAALVAPERVVLCEGRPVSAKGKATKSEFDARCYRVVFAKEFPNTDFISLGNSDDVKDDKLELGRSIQAITAGTKVVRLIDRDLLSPQEATEQEAAGVHVLGRRNIEAYLLDDEVIDAFAEAQGDATAGQLLRDQRDTLLASSVANGNDPDDYKKVAGDWSVFARKHFKMVNSGSTWAAFAVSVLAPMLVPNMTAYSELKQCIFS